MSKTKADRFFIAIAEEHIKAGMLDEAISVLKEGLQAYPNYLGARVSLGKAYLEKGMINEAMKEFEHVVQASPDNLFAHRRLVSIYKDLGRIDDAIKSCETLLVFNPKDKEVTELLSNLMREKMEKASRSETPSADMRPASPAAPRSIIQQEGEKIDFTSSWEIAVVKDRENIRENNLHGEAVMGEFVTETIGDLYIAQGEIEKGADIYKQVLEKEPGNESVREKLTGLTDRRKLQIGRLQDFLEKVQKNKGVRGKNISHTWPES